MSVDGIIQEIKQLHGQDAVTVAEAAAQQLTDDEHRRFRSWNYAEETKRREAEAASKIGQTELLRQLREAGTLPTPVVEAENIDGYTAWTDPGADSTKAPLRGDRCKHDGKVWESLVDFNSWEPGAEGAHAVWMDVTDMLFPPEDGEPVEYVDSQHYTAGDRVTFDGIVYECTADHYAAPGWTPSNAHGYWNQVE